MRRIEAMRIGLISGEYPPMQGGVGAFTQELARHLHALGHEIHVITSRLARPAQPEGERRSWRQLGEPLEAPYGFVHPRARRWRWSDVGMIADVALRYELDVLNIQYQAAAYNMRSAAINLAPARLRGIAPVVVTFHDLRVPYLFPKAGGLRDLVVRILARSAQGAIATNGADFEQLLAWGLPSERVRQIPIGSNVTPHRVMPESVAVVRRQLGLRPADRLLGYFGFVHESKGADLLVEALAALPGDVHLVFVGGRTGASDRANNEAFLARLDALVERLGLASRVHWTGFLDDPGVSAPPAGLRPDGLALPRRHLPAARHSWRRWRTRPGVGAADRAPCQLRHGRTSGSCPRRTPPPWLMRPLALLEDAALLERLGAAAKETAALFSWERIAAATAAFFAELR